jgi:hypothetical protein
MVNVALPLVRTEAPEKLVAVRDTVPVGTGFPEPGALTVTVTVVACAVVMLVGFGITFTPGVSFVVVTVTVTDPDALLYVEELLESGV